MTVLRLVWRATASLGPSLPTANAPSPPASIRSWGVPPPTAAIAALAWAARTAGDFGSPAPTAAGLVAELTSRSDRQVEIWLADSGASLPPQDAPLGLVTLVTASRAGRRRLSIGWLLVHPAARRLGIGRGLVATALAAAQSQGGREVWVETRSDWTASLAFWRACGFTEPGALVNERRV